MGSYIGPKEVHNATATNPMYAEAASAQLNKFEEPLFEFSIWYGFNQHHEVGKDVAIPSNGCLLEADPQSIKSQLGLGYMGLDCSTMQLPFPTLDFGLDQNQNMLIEQLLTNMIRGISFSITDGNLYAKRLCKTRVFVSDKVSKSTLIKRGEEDEPTLIFNPRQEETVFLTFGQEIKVGHHEPMRRVLICMQIEHTPSKQMRKMREDHGTSSMTPLYSGNDEMDNLIENIQTYKI